MTEWTKYKIEQNGQWGRTGSGVEWRWIRKGTELMASLQPPLSYLSAQTQSMDLGPLILVPDPLGHHIPWDKTPPWDAALVLLVKSQLGGSYL